MYFQIAMDCMGATVIKFPGDQTFNHLDKVAVTLINFWPKWSNFRQSLGSI